MFSKDLHDVITGSVEEDLFDQIKPQVYDNVIFEPVIRLVDREIWSQIFATQGTIGNAMSSEIRGKILNGL